SGVLARMRSDLGGALVGDGSTTPMLAPCGMLDVSVLCGAQRCAPPTCSSLARFAHALVVGAFGEPTDITVHACIVVDVFASRRLALPPATWPAIVALWRGGPASAARGER